VIAAGGAESSTSVTRPACNRDARQGNRRRAETKINTEQEQDQHRTTGQPKNKINNKTTNPSNQDQRSKINKTRSNTAHSCITIPVSE
jgi:hypothetical protein